MKINGYCPQGCGETLARDSDDNVVCLDMDCPKPYTVTYLLEDSETEHLVECLTDSWSMKHPLRERINNELLTCDAGTEASHTAQHMPLGTYRLSFDKVWNWERL